MERERITDRANFSSEEKETVLKKSGGVCAHCGKPIFIGYQFSVDHYIPLSKGGVNRNFNLIPLCKDCNKKKGHKIYDPDEYLMHLGTKAMQELKGYYESYIKSFNFVSKNNYLALDSFTVTTFVPIRSMMYSKHPVSVKYVAKRAEYEDLDKLYRYYVDFLKRFDSLSGEEYAKENIQFWFEKGCIYYIEKNNEIKVMVAYNVVDGTSSLNYGINKCLETFVFPKYSTPSSLTMTEGMVLEIPRRIAKEQNIKVIPMIISGLVNDKGFAKMQILKGLKPCGNDYNGKVIQYFLNFGYHTEDISKNSNLEFETQIRSEAAAVNRFFSKIEAAKTVDAIRKSEEVHG